MPHNTYILEMNTRSKLTEYQKEAEKARKIAQARQSYESVEEKRMHEGRGLLFFTKQLMMMRFKV